MKYKNVKKMKKEREERKLTLANQIWCYCLNTKVASISQPFQFAAILCSKCCLSYVLLKLPTVFMLLCCIPSDRPAHDRKARARGSKTSASLTALCVLLPCGVIVHGYFVTSASVPCWMSRVCLLVSEYTESALNMHLC